jgi:hypothetical protein
LINPAIADTTEKVSLSIGNRTLTGLFEGVTRFYADASFLVQPKGSANFHLLGLQAITRKDGDVFSKNRVYVRYSYRIALSKRFSAAAGLTVGFVNYTTKGTQASAGGSATTPDATLGIILSSRTLHLGYSCQQILQPNIRPVGQTLILYRIFNYNLNYLLKLHPQISLNSFIHVRHQPQFPLLVEVAPILVWNNIVETGVNYQFKKGVAVMAGISSLKIYKGKVRLMASYFLNTSNISGVNDNIVEFSLGYAFVK